MSIFPIKDLIICQKSTLYLKDSENVCLSRDLSSCTFHPESQLKFWAILLPHTDLQILCPSSYPTTAFSRKELPVRGFSSVHYKTLILLPSLTSSLSSLCLLQDCNSLKKSIVARCGLKSTKKSCHYPRIILYFFNIKIVLLASYIRLLTKIIHMEHLASARHYSKCFKCFTPYFHSNLYGKPITFST